MGIGREDVRVGMWEDVRVGTWEGGCEGGYREGRM